MMIHVLGVWFFYCYYKWLFVLNKCLQMLQLMHQFRHPYTCTIQLQSKLKNKTSQYLHGLLLFAIVSFFLSFFAHWRKIHRWYDAFPAVY